MAIPSSDGLPNPGPLTEAQRKLVKATVPVLEAHGQAITRLFYKEMIEANPDLRNVFNHSKQQVCSPPTHLLFERNVKAVNCGESG